MLSSGVLWKSYEELISYLLKMSQNKPALTINTSPQCMLIILGNFLSESVSRLTTTQQHNIFYFSCISVLCISHLISCTCSTFQCLEEDVKVKHKKSTLITTGPLRSTITLTWPSEKISLHPWFMGTVFTHHFHITPFIWWLFCVILQKVLQLAHFVSI